MATERLIRVMDVEDAINRIGNQVKTARAMRVAALMALCGVPTADAVEVVHGKWVGIQYDGYADGCPVYDLWECSNCREEYESEGDPPPFNYCHNCGAKMDLEVSDGQA